MSRPARSATNPENLIVERILTSIQPVQPELVLIEQLEVMFFENKTAPRPHSELMLLARLFGDDTTKRREAKSMFGPEAEKLNGT